MNIQEIQISECRAFENNPYRVKDDAAMEMLTESVKENGILIPIVVTPQNGGFEIISGHRRVHAAKKAGLATVPAFIREFDRDSAVIFMVDSNLHREGLLPSEKAFAYRMKLEAMKHQGRTSAQVGQTSVQRLADVSEDSRSQVQRYIRLTYLEKGILDLTDEGRIALTPAVELSYLLPEEQRDLLMTIESEDCTPSYSQAVRMRKLSEQGLLSPDSIFKIMSEVKGNQKEYLKLPTEKYDRYLKRFHTPKEKEDFIEKALAHYSKYLERQKERDCR
jgi:ParB family transcriptional regulator, chromosome partitioning protein